MIKSLLSCVSGRVLGSDKESHLFSGQESAPKQADPRRESQKVLMPESMGNK